MILGESERACRLQGTHLHTDTNCLVEVKFLLGKQVGTYGKSDKYLIPDFKVGPILKVVNYGVSRPSSTETL